MNKTIYQVISYLLKYPTEEMTKILPDMRTEIEKNENKQVKDKIHQFIDHSEHMSLDEWIDHYVDHFDFGRLTNLYVTYLKLGEQRERGLELLKLKKYYEAHGFEVTDKELPDYLPLMLEFCANVSVEVSNDLLQIHSKAIVDMHDRLKETTSFYSLLFEALVLQMENHGIRMTVQKS